MKTKYELLSTGEPCTCEYVTYSQVHGSPVLKTLLCFTRF